MNTMLDRARTMLALLIVGLAPLLAALLFASAAAAYETSATLTGVANVY
jgi:hypothetical protein